MSIFDWHKQSPFTPLGEHMRKVRNCAAQVLPMFEAVRAADYDRLQKLAEGVFEAEHEADRVKAEIRRTVPKAFALPVFRGDLLAFVHTQDEIADTVEDVAFQLTIKHLEMPAAIADNVLAFVQQALSACERLFKAVELLPELRESDFAGARGNQILELITATEQEEYRADKKQYRLAQQLFGLEDQMKPTDIFLWSGILQNVGALANHADKTAERLRRMLGR